MQDANSDTSWFQIVVRIPESQSEGVEDWLLLHGCLGIERRDTDCLSAPVDLAPGWVELRAPWGADRWPEQLQVRLDRFLDELPDAKEWREAEPSRLELLAQEDWEHNWRAHFSAVELGRFFVYPGWLQADKPGLLPVRIDPGLAFGTGMHPTTRLCMLGLDRLLRAGRPASVLDVGCGSGILAIAAARAGVSRVVAMDNDPQACQVTRENLEINGLATRVDVVCGQLSQVRGQFSAVLANILSGVLLRLQNDLIRCLDRGGQLLLSGLLLEEADQVARAFSDAGLVMIQRQVDGEWALLHLERPS